MSNSRSYFRRASTIVRVACSSIFAGQVDDPVGVIEADARFREIGAFDLIGPKLPPIAITTSEHGALIGFDLELPGL